ncbi:hypothetical protein VKS41_003253 [Umbelopsis sp. WA50703]|jgi:ubiquinone/menaquinone biosynthesis C-methylase UbiE
MPAQTPHDVALQGFGTGADDYDKARPSYPATALESLRIDLGLVPSETKVLDLAAGTGKFTELLAKEGYQITAVEPVATMRAKITEQIPSVTAVEGTSWKIPVEDESQDVVTIAQAFHWFDDIETLRECHRVLKPQGRLICIWNMESQERSKWVKELREVYQLHDSEVPQYRKGRWRNVFDTEEAARLYELPLNHRLFTNDFHVKGKEVVWQRIKSKSYIAVLPPKDQDELRQRVYAILENPAYGFATDSTGQYLFPHETDLYWAQKR